MDLEGIILSEINQIAYDLTYIWNIKKRRTNKKSNKHKDRPDWWLPELRGG